MFTASTVSTVSRVWRASVLPCLMVVAVSLLGAEATFGGDDVRPPSRPGHFMVSAVSESQARLAWNASFDNVGVVRYNVYRNGAIIRSLPRQTYADRGLQAGTTYTYSVTAVDAAGNESIPTPQRTVTTLDVTTPTPPEGLAGTAVSENETALTWQPAIDNVGISGYRVYRDGALLTTTTDTTFNNSFLMPWTEYTYSVTAYDAAQNESAPTPEETVRTLDTTTPSVPDQLTAGAVASTRIDLTWNAATDNVGVVEYNVYRDGQLHAVTMETTFSDTEVAASTTHTYAVSAVDEAFNESELSASVEASTATLVPSTSLPQGVIAMNGRNLPVPQEILTHSDVTGVVVRNWWVDAEPEEGVYDWSYFDTIIPQVAAAGKWVWLVIEAGGARNTPQWVFESGVQTFTFEEDGEVKTTPVWWDPIFREKKANFIRAMGAHFARNPTVISISAHDLNANSDDFHIPKTVEDVANWQAIGYTTEKMIEALKATIDVTMEAFPDRVIRTPIGRGIVSLDPDANFIAREVITYANATYPGRVFFQRHALTAVIPDPDIDTELFVWQLFLDHPPNVGAEMVDRVTNEPGCRMNGGVAPCDDVVSILQEAVRLGKRYGTQYQEIFGVDVLNPDLQDVIRFAQDVLTIPTMPMELAAISVSSTDIELNWVESSDPVGVTGYVVYRDGLEIAAITGASYLDQTVTPNTTYTYEVSAVDAEGNESERSSPLLVTTS